MIDELHIRDLALIDEVWLELGPGLTVLTGETGAGKTVLLSALKLLMGERADSGAVRHGSDEAFVEARFSPSDGDELVVSRRVTSGGRSRCALNGEMATVTNLEETVGPLVDLHGQHEHQALLRPSTHVRYLDAYGEDEISPLLRAYEHARSGYFAASAEVERILATLARSAEELEVNRLILAEIDRVDPRRGEDDELQSLVPALQNAEAIASAVGAARSSLTGEGGATDSLGAALVSLRKVAPHLEVLSQAVDELGAVLSAVEESSVGLREAAAGVVYDADELDRTLSRLAALDGLKKRFGPTLDVVIDRRESLRATSEVVESGDEALSRARGEADRAERAYRDAAQALDSARSAVALRFGAAVLEEMRGLELGNVAFEVTLRPLDFGSWTGSGPSSVEFMYSPAAGVPTKPLVRIASGGEISRVMLALKSALGAGDPTDTLVFDEVDAGIGGATATAVGERLAALAQRRQVIVVTHLAQVAAYADTHYVVRKVESEDATFTAVIPVEGDDRTREVARMLSGETSAVALEHARVLLNDH